MTAIEAAARLPSALGPVRGAVQVPGSKSVTNRALLVAALADGTSVLDGALFSDDTHYMSAALRLAGVAIEADPEQHRFIIHGSGAAPGAITERIFLGNAGTAMRFLTGYFALGHGEYLLDGSARMRERPIQELLDALNTLGGDTYSTEGNGCPPVMIRAQGLQGGRADIPGERSSQFLSSILLNAPYASEPVEVNVIGQLASAPFVELTRGVMAAFGIPVEHDGCARYRVEPGRYSARSYTVEPDASSASYFLAAAAITNGSITVRGLSLQSQQGDIEFARILERMGCRVEDTPEGLRLTGCGVLRGADVDMNACSDVALTLAAVAPFCSTPTHIRNVGHMRVQETDRIHAMTTELRRAGASVEEREDGFSIYPAPPHAATFETYDDHRMAMSLSLIGLVVPGCAVLNPDCVSKTFPGYWEILTNLVQ